MNKSLLITATTLLLCACTQTASTDPAVSAPKDAPAETAAPPPEPSQTGAQTGAQIEAASPAATDQTVAAPDGDSATNKAIDETLGDHTKYQAVIVAFQKAVADGDKQAVAALVDYPIGVTIDGKPKTIKDAQAFVADCDRFMTPAIVKVITEQKYEDLFVNDKGVMFGSGEAWINGICRDDACEDFDVKVVTLQPAE